MIEERSIMTYAFVSPISLNLEIRVYAENDEVRKEYNDILVLLNA